MIHAKHQCSLLVQLLISDRLQCSALHRACLVHHRNSVSILHLAPLQPVPHQYLAHLQLNLQWTDSVFISRRICKVFLDTVFYHLFTNAFFVPPILVYRGKIVETTKSFFKLKMNANNKSIHMIKKFIVPNVNMKQKFPMIKVKWHNKEDSIGFMNEMIHFLMQWPICLFKSRRDVPWCCTLWW